MKKICTLAVLAMAFTGMSFARDNGHAVDAAVIAALDDAVAEVDAYRGGTPLTPCASRRQ